MADIIEKVLRKKPKPYRREARGVVRGEEVEIWLRKSEGWGWVVSAWEGDVGPKQKLTFRQKSAINYFEGLVKKYGLKEETKNWGVNIKETELKKLVTLYRNEAKKAHKANDISSELSHLRKGVHYLGELVKLKEVTKK